MKIRFLTVERVKQLHADAIKNYGGSEGLREPGMLDSALAMPKAGFGGNYLHEDVFEMAAAYLYHLVQNHPFIDGNKRVGLDAALVFLKLNGTEVIATQDEIVDMVLQVAQGRLHKPAIADFLRQHAQPGPE